MTTRREFLAAAAALAAAVPGGSFSRALAQQRFTQDDITRFEPLGNVTLVHLADLHAQLNPLYFREAAVNLGVGDAKGKIPHITGEAYRQRYGVPPNSAGAYALTADNFAALAKDFGRMGGLDRIATVVKQIRGERADRMLFLDGGDTWQGSYTALKTKAADIVDCMKLIKPDAMVGHWEFTYGADRVKEIVDDLGFPFLGQNIRDTEWNEQAFEPTAMFERGGVKIAVIGQAFPYTPISNPRWMFPNWTFGIREEDLQKNIDKARRDGAGLVVLLSHNGFDVDRKLATRVKGIDVILTAHTHDALPEAEHVGKTLLIAGGSHGKFITRLDLDVQGGEIKNYRFKLMPIFSDIIAPDAEMAAKIKEVRAPHEAHLRQVVGRSETLLYRRGNFNGTFDDVICDALLSERDAEIALSPGVRWGTSVLPGQDITREDIYNATAITYPNAYRIKMAGERIKLALEDVADNIFNADPYYQGGGDMVRVGGLSFSIAPAGTIGNRISDLTVTKTGKPLEAAKEYTVAGWASVNEGTEGPPIWDVVASHIAKVKIVAPKEDSRVKVVGM
ncbi:trifunctional nucleotide phosphoesterase protein YfkN precursor [Variibacter gotjawalensis]|uniref:Trifunctional nucleotide phosphoesterase protein YfkN n=1 Tax=Variibacter gotjawalensis TaxID=1333996 RepID=A0A0S3PTM2_9BRAD|nr:thiosulfohydrolase SoxB [Variibacter gotjawalensis]NIK49481.1 sulfur-oxidizing protein SoxB [Variibacter gotjawalensis]RZS51333.1 sulfate thiol esterase SoxB [Variibacter gotjawalensis]BAT59166.1 trifunctional nucleotide phosphoesterase protein YfkN precursor [Variibacter gotjawalensis]